MMRVEDPFCDLNDYFDFEPQTIQDTHCEDLFEEFYDTDFLDILQDITDTVCGSQQADFDQSQSSAVGNSGESSVDLSCNVSGINERGSHLGSWSANDEHSPFSEPCSTLSDVNQDQHNACMEGVANLASPDEQILLEVLPEYQVEEDMTGLIEMGDAVTSSQVVKQEDLLLRGYQTCDVDKGIVATGFDQGMFLSDNSEHSPCSNTSSGSDSYDLDALGGISPSSEASVTFSNIPSVKVSLQPVQPNLPRPVIIAPSVRSAKTYSGSVSVASNVHVVSSKQQPIIYTVKTSQWNSSRVANGSAGAGLSQRQILSHPYLRTSATVIRSVQRNPQVGATSTHPVVNVSPANVTEEQPKYVIQKVVQGTKPCEVTPVCLTDEEYQVFVAEGYPIPQRYPLSKSDEKNLKKVRRKLKNKWSAQESRRKKKEFVESLQEQCESISSENGELRKRVSDLEHDNRTLISQLRKLQDLVSSFGATTFKTAAAIRVPQTKQLCRMETTSDKQAAVAANGRNSTVLMMFTMVFASLLLGSSPFGVNSYLQYTHDASNPVVFASLPSRHILQDSSESIGYQLSARILKNSLLLLSPFAPARVVHADLSAFRPNEQEVKSRVLQFPVGEKHANPLAPSAAQEKGFASSLPGPEKLEKALIPIRYQDITLWSDSETAVFYNPTEERLAFIQFYGKVDEKTNASEEFVVELPNLLTLSKQVNIEDATVEFEAGCCLTSSLNRSTELEAEKAL